MLHLLNSLTKRFDLQYNNLICLNISASSLLLLLNIYPKYLMESVYEIGIELICNTGNANLYNFGRKATQYDFKALKFKSISILYLKHMLISSCNAMAQGAIKQRSSA